MPEILNIEYHIKRMLVKALNEQRTYAAAATQLGVTERTVARKVKAYKIRKDRKTGTYFLPQEPTLITITLVK